MALFARAPLLCVAFLAIAPLLCALVENEVQMTLYMSQVIEGPKTNDISVVPTGGFGTISVNDWAILDGPDPSAKVVGRAQGLHTASSQSDNSWFTAVNLVFKDESRYNGSRLAVIGTFPINSEWTIVGGTGTFSMARGTINLTFHAYTKEGALFKLDVHAYYYSTVYTAVDGKTGCNCNSKRSEPIVDN